MHKKEQKLIISFASTTMALAMEKTCKEVRMDGRLIPLPKEISAACGMAWCSAIIDIECWKQFLEEKNLSYEQIKILMI